MNEIELNILLWMRDVLQCAFLDWFMPLITKLGDEGIFWIAVAVVLLFIPKCRKAGAVLGLSLLIGLLIGNLTLKPLIARIRPYDLFYELNGEKIKLLIDAESSFSFPSGHTLASFEAATALLINKRKLGIIALVLAILIAFSRMYLFVHYPTDILGGIVLGVINAILATIIVNKVINIYNSKKKKL